MFLHIISNIVLANSIENSFELVENKIETIPLFEWII